LSLVDLHSVSAVSVLEPPFCIIYLLDTIVFINMVYIDGDYIRDDWPESPDGSTWDGKNLLQLLQVGKSPFAKDWDVQVLVDELEQRLKTEITDIAAVDKGSNNYVSLL